MDIAVKSPHSGSEADSPCPTARLILSKHEACQSSQINGPISPQFGSSPTGSPGTSSILMAPHERSCVPSSACPSVIDVEICEGAGITSNKEMVVETSMEHPYLLSFTNVPDASSSTLSTCSSLPSSSTSVSSFNASSASSQEYHKSVSNNADFTQRSSLRRTEVPISRARQFCQQACADCDLEKLDVEMAELTREMQALQANMASTRKLLAWSYSLSQELAKWQRSLPIAAIINCSRRGIIVNEPGKCL